MNRTDVTEMIVAARIDKGIKWSDVADALGLSRSGLPPHASAR